VVSSPDRDALDNRQRSWQTHPPLGRCVLHVKGFQVRVCQTQRNGVLGWPMQYGLGVMIEPSIWATVGAKGFTGMPGVWPRSWASATALVNSPSAHAPEIAGHQHSIECEPREYRLCAR
jgi:hypothetical protein